MPRLAAPRAVPRLAVPRLAGVRPKVGLEFPACPAATLCPLLRCRFSLPVLFLPSHQIQRPPVHPQITLPTTQLPMKHLLQPQRGQSPLPPAQSLPLMFRVSEGTLQSREWAPSQVSRCEVSQVECSHRFIHVLLFRLGHQQNGDHNELTLIIALAVVLAALLLSCTLNMLLCCLARKVSQKYCTPNECQNDKVLFLFS